MDVTIDNSTSLVIPRLRPTCGAAGEIAEEDRGAKRVKAATLWKGRDQLRVERAQEKRGDKHESRGHASRITPIQRVRRIVATFPFDYNNL